MTEQFSFRAGPSGAAIATCRDQLEFVYNQLTTEIVVVFVVVGKQGQNQFPPLPGSSHAERKHVARHLPAELFTNIQRRVATDLLKLRHAMQF
jgi:hypothetical protein